ncbi:DUF2061 domain-containing protein [Halobacterium bonnevillei]|jgi:uncharacterized membrane protein|uniref:DUF2061 domain-containing protein n=1 Tax=Halobacterium bonnevillei TaxID=2692200 RepID=A0A6B0SJU1_9EURY|nr:DUF2061 domain-containing protein [Halobacterium bonnevillei]MXR19152.1 DUF2061 domain-containing protein [Halobacterium bonnevillei]
MTEAHYRSLAKAGSYRVFATSLVFAIAFLYTGTFDAAAKIGITAAVGKTLLYYVWERIWNNITWGRHSPN